MDLRSLFGMSPQQSAAPNLGNGMAQQALQVIQSRPYQLHVQEAQALGQQPMTPEQFMQRQKAQALAQQISSQ